MVEAAGVGTFRLTDSTELVENAHPHESQKVLKWAVHYTPITRERIRNSLENGK